MESIYYVMSWACHRTCTHCYEDRFRPYVGDELKRVVDECRAAFPKIIANLPERMTYIDPEDMREKRGRIILAGGEILLDAVREAILYPALEMFRAKYGNDVQLIIQTTGDTLRPHMIEELLARGVWMISVSGIDSFHQGLETAEAQQALVDKLTKMFDDAGMRLFAPFAAETGQGPGDGPFYQFFGAQPGTWIGRLWPRGRAVANGLSTATITDNFCNQWSGGLNFLQSKLKGSEVSIEPNGNVYPCCAKTKRPIGNLQNETLDAIIARCTGDPVYEAISMGHPERMGIARGWSVEKFLEASTTASGYRNLCIGCDKFHDEVLSGLVTIA